MTDPSAASVTSGTIGIIGVGEIAAAVVDGLGAEASDMPQVLLSPRGAATAIDLAARHDRVRVCADNQEVADGSDLLMIAVRPPMLAEAMTDVRLRPGTIVVSVVAGVALDRLRELLGPDVSVVRAIPLPAVRRRRGTTATYPANTVVSGLFDQLGGTLPVAVERDFDTLSAATGSVSAHLSMIATVAAWADRHTDSGTDAAGYVREVFLGLGGGLADPSRTLDQLAADHETPGGLNEQLRRTWFSTATATALDDALDRLLERVTRGTMD